MAARVEIIEDSAPAGNWSGSRDGTRFIKLSGQAIYYVDLTVTKSSSLTLLRNNLRDPYVATISPDGRRAAVGDGASVLVLNVENGELVQRQQGDQYSPTELAFSPDGQMIISDLGYYHQLKIWNAQSGKPYASIKLENIGGKVGYSALMGNRSWYQALVLFNTTAQEPAAEILPSIIGRLMAHGF